MSPHCELSPILDALPPYRGNEAAAPMLPRECYTSAAFFEFEREAVFARNWVCVGREDQLPAPGDMLAVSVAGERLIVARSASGALHAMSAVCQHRGHMIDCAAEQPRGLLRCPLHFWTYDLEGRLVGAPRWATRWRDCATRSACRRCGSECGTASSSSISTEGAASGAEPRQGRAVLGGLPKPTW